MTSSMVVSTEKAEKVIEWGPGFLYSSTCATERLRKMSLEEVLLFPDM